jgi:hypothetical protein
VAVKIPRKEQLNAKIHGTGGYPGETEFGALRKLADSSEEVRFSFIEQLVVECGRMGGGARHRREERVELLTQPLA